MLAHVTARTLGRVTVMAAVLAAVAATAVSSAASAPPSPQSHRSGIVTFGPYRLADFVNTNTCGDLWGQGPLRHAYQVYPQNADGSYLVTAEGHVRYVTYGGPSFGACNNGQPNDGATAAAGIVVQTEYHFVFLVHGGTLDPNATCADPCAPPDFFAAAFGPSATFDLLEWAGTLTTRCNGDAFFLVTADGVEHDAGDITGQRHAC